MGKLSLIEFQYLKIIVTRFIFRTFAQIRTAYGLIKTPKKSVGT